MSETVLHDAHSATVFTYPNWGAIWGGVFSFFAIWCVFGLLGMSLFDHNAPAANVPMGIWAIVLTVIAMYVAGRTTGHLAGVTRPRDGVLHGLIMFGLAVVIALTIMLWTGSAVQVVNAAGEHTPYLVGVFSDMGWLGFLCLFVGWLAAMVGASSGTHVIHGSVQQVSHAA